MKPEPMRTLTVSLTPQQISRLNRAVERGSYASNSEAIREALRLWERREELRQIELERFKLAYDQGRESGAPRRIDPEEFLERMKTVRRGHG